MLKLVLLLYYPACLAVVSVVGLTLWLFDQMFAAAVAVTALVVLGVIARAAFAYAAEGGQDRPPTKGTLT